MLALNLSFLHCINSNHERSQERHISHERSQESHERSQESHERSQESHERSQERHISHERSQERYVSHERLISHERSQERYVSHERLISHERSQERYGDIFRVFVKPNDIKTVIVNLSLGHNNIICLRDNEGFLIDYYGWEIEDRFDDFIDTEKQVIMPTGNIIFRG
jgi:hypothetical protein